MSEILEQPAVEETAPEPIAAPAEAAKPSIRDTLESVLAKSEERGDDGVSRPEIRRQKPRQKHRTSPRQRRRQNLKPRPSSRLPLGPPR
jgi:hypothetical protein